MFALLYFLSITSGDVGFFFWLKKHVSDKIFNALYVVVVNANHIDS